MVTTALNINFTPGGVPITLHVTQYDAGTREYVFTPYSSPGTVDLSAVSVVSLEATKPDGHAVINSCTYDSGTNKITYVVQQQLCAVIGKVWSKIVIRNAGGDILGTAAIIWIVEPAGMTDGSILSDSDISAIEEWVEEIGDATAETEENALKSEGYAVGTQNGTAVASGSPYYHNNSAYYSGEASTSATSAGTNALISEGYAVGKQNGTAVSSGTYYQNNAKYYSDRANVLYGHPFQAATAAAMTDTSKVYVYTGSETGYVNGNYYFYNGSSWVSGGAFNSTALNTDTTLSIPGAAADAAVTGANITELKEELGRVTDFDFTIIQNTFIYKVNGSTVASSSYACTDYIPVVGSIWFYTFTNNDNSGYAFYDANKNAVAYGGTYQYNNTWTELTVPTGAVYFRVSVRADRVSSLRVSLPVSNELNYVLTRIGDLDELGTKHDNDISDIINNYIGDSDDAKEASVIGIVTPLDGFYSGNSGAFTATSDYKTYEYTLPTGRYDYQIDIYQRSDGNSDGIYYIYMVLDADGNLLQSAKQKTTNQTLSFEVPQTAKTIRYTKPASNVLNTCVLSWKDSVFSHINNIEDVLANELNDIAVFVGDSYVSAGSLGADVANRFSTVICDRMGLTEKNYGVGSTGFITGDTTYIAQLNSAIADTSFDNSKVKYVFICGGRNDYNNHIEYMESTYVTAVQTVITTAISAFANAKIILIPMMADCEYIGQTFYPIYETIIYAAQNLNVYVIPNAYTWLIGMKDMILTDGVHPNISGHAVIAGKILNALTTGYSFASPSSVIVDAVSEAIDTTKDHYFTISQENGLIRYDADFQLTAGVAHKTTLFSLTVPTTRNVPAYIGKHARVVIGQKTDNTLLTVEVTCTISDSGGYSITVQNYGALTPGRYIIESKFMQFGLERYASYGVWS